MSCCGRNQTSEKSASLLQAGDIKILGCGVFLVPAPELGILEFKKIIVENLTAEETIKRGNNCQAYKWFHPSDMTPSQLQSAALVPCSGLCPGGTGNLCSGHLCFCDGTSNWCH